MALARRERFELPELFRRVLDTDWDSSWMRVEEFVEDDAMVVRAELPGLDPDKDVELSVSDGMLHIHAHREETSEHKEKDSYRSEFRYGSFTRTLALPPGTKEEDISASYKDGVLEVRAPMAKETKPPVTRIPVTRS